MFFKFKFIEHIEIIVNKANKQLDAIAILNYIKMKMLIPVYSIYKSFIKPILEYNSVICSPFNKII